MNERIPSLIASLLKIEEGVSLPELDGDDIGYYLYERYIKKTNNRKRKLYYYIKPLIPRAIQLVLRKKYISIQSKVKFPAWPIEPVIVDKVYNYLRAVIAYNRIDRIFRIAPWPKKKKFAFVITHDVEWDNGLRHAPEIAKIEREYGFVSSWNIVPQRYPIDWKIINHLREHGAEIGVHGLYHDGKLFQSKSIFLERAQKINNFAAEWGAVGFRSESTLRNTEWMPELKVEYDTSFPDTDPYEPQPGGCCSIWPYFINNLVELPLTLPQDHTLFEIMNMSDISVWKQKVDWIEEHGGIALINVHPDYMSSLERIRIYETFLKYMQCKEGMWHVLPREVARWWRERHECRLINDNDKLKVIGSSPDMVSIIMTKISDTKVTNRYV